MEFPNSNSSFGTPIDPNEASNPDFQNMSDGLQVYQGQNFLTDTQVQPLDIANIDNRLTMMEDSGNLDQRNQQHLLSGDLHNLEDVIPEQDSEIYQASEQNLPYEREERKQLHVKDLEGKGTGVEPKVLLEDSDCTSQNENGQPLYSYFSKTLQFVHCFCRIPIKDVDNFMDVWSQIEQLVKEFLRSKKAKILHSKEFSRELRFYFVVAKQGFEQSEWSRQIYEMCRYYLDGEPSFLQIGRAT